MSRDPHQGPGAVMSSRTRLRPSHAPIHVCLRISGGADTRTGVLPAWGQKCHARAVTLLLLAFGAFLYFLLKWTIQATVLFVVLVTLLMVTVVSGLVRLASTRT
jgi:hypothetical protein